MVSKHVSALEDSLGTQLLQRTTRKLVPTDTGISYYQQVKTIPEQVHAAQQVLQPYAKKPRGILKVISPANFAESLRLEVIPDFLTAHPEVTLNLKLVRPVRDYVNHDFDIIILWKLSNANFPDYNLIPKKLLEMNIGLYASPDYLKKHGTPQTPEDLEHHNCFSSVGRQWPFRKGKGVIKQINVSGNLISKDDSVIQTATSKGLGIAYSYPFIFQKELQEKTVVPVLQEYTNLRIDIYAFYHPTPYLPLKISAFIKGMQDYYGNMQEAILKRGMA